MNNFFTKKLIEHLFGKHINYILFEKNQVVVKRPAIWYIFHCSLVVLFPVTIFTFFLKYANHINKVDTERFKIKSRYFI
jgi:hypothetical protein